MPISNIFSVSVASVSVMILLSGCASVQVRTAIDIDAPAPQVWQVLTDFRKYPEWNPYHVSVKGKPVSGAQLALEIHRPDGKTIEIDPHILELDVNRELTWGGGIRGIFFGRHVMRLEPLSANRVRFIHNEDFDGIAVGFADLPVEVLTAGYENMNRALKARVEQAQSDSDSAALSIK